MRVNSAEPRRQHIIAMMGQRKPQATIARELGLSRQRIHQLLNPEKRRAADYVTHAKLRERRSATVCQNCGSGAGRLEAHHADYSKPLDITFLCHACHVVVHHPYSKTKIAAEGA